MNNISEEINYLRKLAIRVRDYAELPVMEERKNLWEKHNRGEVTTPPILFETFGFNDEIMPQMQCQSPELQFIESMLIAPIVNYEKIGDDKVVSAELNIPMEINFRLFGLEPERHLAEDDKGRSLGFSVDYPITDLEIDFENLNQSLWSYNQEATMKKFELAQDLVGDILSVKLFNDSHNWQFSITAHAVYLMGMENMFLAMMETPDLVQKLFSKITDDLISWMRWQEDNNLLTLNNANHYAGSGSYGFSNELPQSDFLGKVRLKDLWGNLNSQETVGVSPGQFMDEVYPHYEKLAGIFGLNYYGCCEAVHNLWDKGLKNLPNLRKISASPWCDDNIMGNFLRGGKVIFCSKVSPNFIGIDKFDRAGLSRDIEATLRATKSCPLEFSYRDIYTLCGEVERARATVELTRELISKFY